MKLPLDASERNFALSPMRAFLKRTFDIAVALAMLPVIAPLTLVLLLIARKSTGQSGLFKQQRIGLYGEPFTLLKIRSMRPLDHVNTHVTTTSDPRITPFGAFLRKTKLDEMPQLFNVLMGDMSFVGPRPDVSEIFENIDPAYMKVLCVRPGITGPASVEFRDEERILETKSDPEKYNREVIFPAKIRTNLSYIENYSLISDVVIMLRTVLR